MTYVKKTWKDRISEYPTRRQLLDSGGTSSIVTVSRSEGIVSQEGDAFSAENMNDLETRIDNEFTEMRSTTQDITLVTSGWSNRVYTIRDARIKVVEGVETIQELMVSRTATQAQREAFNSAGIADYAQSDGQLQIQATDTVPTINIPVTIIFRGWK